MKTYYSEITVNDVLGMHDHNIGIVRISYNGEMIWNADSVEDSISYYSMVKLYGNKRVYYYNTSIVDFHHCELNIVGE